VLSLRANLDQSRTPRERRAVVKITLGFFLSALVYLVALYGVRAAAFEWWDSRLAWSWVAQVLVVGFVLVWPVALHRVMCHMREVRSAERLAHPELFAAPRDWVGSTAGEYRSAHTLFGVPLVHVRYASPDAGQPAVFGWFAGGDRAHGLICAWGGVAIAPISAGSVSLGLIAVGNLSVGLFSFGTVAAGWLAIGCAAVGVHAAAWLSALGWTSAQGGGFSVARIVAEGPVAFAQHANDAAARAAFGAPVPVHEQMTFITVLTLAALIPLIAYVLGVRKRLGPSRAAKGN
jgi:hypothetical protein